MLGRPLSPRERHCLGLAALGLKDREIADFLGIHFHVVRKHFRNAAWKLDAVSKTHAVVLAIAFPPTKPVT